MKSERAPKDMFVPARRTFDLSGQIFRVNDIIMKLMIRTHLFSNLRTYLWCPCIDVNVMAIGH